MGKREIGELSIFDVVIYLVMSELLALAITELDEPMSKAIIPIATLALLQLFVSYVLLKSKSLRDIIDGKPVILIHNGLLNQKEMKKQRYNIDDLLSQLREKEISCLSEVQFAVLENNGTLSVLRRGDCEALHPVPIIQDRIVNEKVLLDLHKDITWLQKEIEMKGYASFSQIFLCMVVKDGLYVLGKDK